ncbi:hypothetical protein Acsp04_61840 [Actinomadura sp. NBRC 104425]|uniref:hypothetical protein n=1 Tax=Actinomadura sp. NBRC 104425 TaxID=3032204 RepID=UPI0024A264CD|nr:hypothetical protein [Actinomadura sp. NBRC 104425]GLZ15949.1 hypothetical protein Acsp04_61840 [Actinomadura sp. NBRC 104425]
MIHPGVQQILASVIDAVEREIAPAVEDEYAASLCRTVAQMLRAVRVRVDAEPRALAEDNAELRGLLAGWGDDLPRHVRHQVAEAVAREPEPRYPALPELQEDALRLRAALVSVIDAVPQEDHPVRVAARRYLRRQLEREQAWQQDAFTGPRR